MSVETVVEQRQKPGAGAVPHRERQSIESLYQRIDRSVSKRIDRSVPEAKALDSE